MSKNSELFKRELESLCRKYNVNLFAGYKGIVFDFENEEDDISCYYNQDFKTKEFFRTKEDNL